MTDPLRIGFVPGAIPDKWFRIWRERESSPIEPVALSEYDDPRGEVVAGRLDMCFTRLPIERDGLHLIPLYDEVPVVVVGKEHPVAAYDDVDLDDLADEQLVAGDVPGWDEIRTATPLPFPPMSLAEAIEVVASGTGIAILPMSLARLHHRKDVVHRPVHSVPPSSVGLCWLVANEDPRLETFIGIVRGRRATSSRGAQAASAPSANRSESDRAPGKDSGDGQARTGRARRSGQVQARRAGAAGRRGGRKGGPARGGRRGGR